MDGKECYRRGCYREEVITNASLRVRVSRFRDSDITKVSARVRDTAKASVRGSK